MILRVLPDLNEFLVHRELVPLRLPRNNLDEAVSTPDQIKSLEKPVKSV